MLSRGWSDGVAEGCAASERWSGLEERFVVVLLGGRELQDASARREEQLSLLVVVGEEEWSVDVWSVVGWWPMGSSSVQSRSTSEEPKTNLRQMSSSSAGVGDRSGMGGEGAAARMALKFFGVASFFSGVVDSLSATHHDFDDIFGSVAVYVRISTGMSNVSSSRPGVLALQSASPAQVSCTSADPWKGPFDLGEVHSFRLDDLRWLSSPYPRTS